MTWGAVAVAGAAVVGGVMASDSASSAQNAQQDAANQSNALSMSQYNQTRADNAPFLSNGTAANNQLANFLGISSDTNRYIAKVRENGGDVPQGWTPDPQAVQAWAAQNPASADSGYGSLNRQFSAADLAADVPYQTGMQFGLDQGTQGINRLAAASGSLNSGATLKALAKFGNDYGNQQAGAAQNRFTANQTNTYNRLAGLSGSGQTAANTVDSAGASTANALSNTAIGLGNARGASAIAQGNSISNGANSISNYYQQQQLLNSLKGSNSNYDYNNPVFNQ